MAADAGTAGSYCIIGGGIIGSWAALHLARAGVKTVLMEQFPMPHTRGASHGASRVIRLLGDENLAALEFSYAEWRALERKTGDELLVQTGLINVGPEGDEYLAKFMAIVKAGGYDVEWLDADELRRRHPAVRYPGLGACSDPSGAILLAHKCVAAVQREFVRLGGRIVQAAAEAVEPAEGACVVRARPLGEAAARELAFAKVAVCAGPWSKRLLPRCAHLLSAQAIPVTYWKEKAAPHQHAAAAGFPVIYNARLKNIYAVPSYEYAGLTKVLVHSGPEAEPDARDTAELQPTIDYVAAYVKEHMPLLDHERPAIVETCMYTMTPDSKPLIDLYHERVAVATGFSGSGFKHAPASGKMVAALLLRTEASLPEGFHLRRYRIARFAENDTHSLKDAGRLLDKTGRSML